MRLIDIEPILRRKLPLLVMLDEILSAPNIDLVRCGDCKYWGNSYICWRRRAKPIAMNPDDFCSYGERKET